MYIWLAITVKTDDGRLVSYPLRISDSSSVNAQLEIKGLQVAHLCKGKIYPLPSEYNASSVTDHTMNPKVHHYAAHRNWFTTWPLAQKYKGDVIDVSK